MDRIIPVIVVIGILILGFIMKAINLKTIINKIDFTNTYCNDFIQLANEIFEKKSFNQSLYYKLTKNVKSMQCELGSDGLYAYAVDNFKGYSTTDYELLINFLPELRTAINDMNNFIIANRLVQSARDCDDMFVRHLGILEDSEKEIRKVIFNPFSCFSEGIKAILAFPIFILNWIGLMSYETLMRIRVSLIAKIVNSIIVIVGLISAIITIVLGWTEFQQMVTKFFP